MQTDKVEDEGKSLTEEQMNGCNESAFGVSAPSVAVGDSSAVKVVGRSNNVKVSSPDEFYEKITRFYESSGLSLIFNFRETKINLYLFYKDVTQRGGYYQVTKEGSWDEVASTLNAEHSVFIPPNKIQMLYANLFYQFEQTYHYRTQSKAKEAQLLKAALTGDSLCSTKSAGRPIKKRKHSENNNDSLVEKHVSLQSSFQLPTASDKPVENNLPLQTPSEEKNLVLQTPTKAKENRTSVNKEMKRHSNAPIGFRTAYMIYLRMECDRLKKMHGKGSARQYRDMVTDAWKHLSDSERQPYLEAAKRDKERYTREMAEFKIVYDQMTETKNVSASTKSTTVIDFAKPSLQIDSDYHVALPDDAYHVTLPPNTAENVTDEELAAEIMQKATSNDPPFQLNWDGGYP